MSKSRTRNQPNSPTAKAGPKSGKRPPQDRSKPQGERPRQSRAHVTSGQWLWGQHAVEAALANPRRTLNHLVATRTAAARLGKTAASAQDIAPHELANLLPNGAVHQGIAGLFEPLPDVSLDDLIGRNTARIVILDQVSDPHNLGAIFRSAAAFGFGGLVLQTKNAPPITGVVAKSAAGAIETVPECRVVNIARALDQLGEAGYHTVGLAGGGRATIGQAVSGAAKVAIVLGAEGPGLRPAVAKACAELARIPIDAAMESLNVSNAAAIAFYEAYRSDT